MVKTVIDFGAYDSNMILQVSCIGCSRLIESFIISIS